MRRGILDDLERDGLRRDGIVLSNVCVRHTRDFYLNLIIHSQTHFINKGLTATPQNGFHGVCPGETSIKEAGDGRTPC